MYLRIYLSIYLFQRLLVSAEVSCGMRLTDTGGQPPSCAARSAAQFLLPLIEPTMTPSEFRSTGTGMLERRAETIAGTIRMLQGCIRQQQAVARAAAAAAPHPVTLGASRPASGAKAWGMGDGWESHGLGAQETRLRLLTLQGQWLEAEGLLLREQERSSGGGGGGDRSGATGRVAKDSFADALGALQEAAELGERIASSPGSQASGMSASTRNNLTGGVGGLFDGRSDGVAGRDGSSASRATSEAILRLARLCDRLVAEEGVLKSGETVTRKSRQELAALAVESYLRAMSAG